MKECCGPLIRCHADHASRDAIWYPRAHETRREWASGFRDEPVLVDQSAEHVLCGPISVDDGRHWWDVARRVSALPNRLLGKCSWQAEVGKDAPVAEPGDGGDAVA